MENIHIQNYKSPYGELILGAFDGKLCLADWRYRRMRTSIDKRLQKYFNAVYIEHEDTIVDAAITQLEEYFRRQRKIFDLPILTAGTDFQRSVWDALLEISYGSVITYQKMAENLGNKNAVRAVAAANGANAISIIIPCHRVIGSDGHLTGYGGGLWRKEWLLKHEGALLL